MAGFPSAWSIASEKTGWNAKTIRSVTKKFFQASLRWFLTYRTKSRYTNWEVQRHLLNLWDSEHWTRVFLVSPSHRTNRNLTDLTVTLTSTCQVVRCQGDYLLSFWVLTSTSAFYYRHVMVRGWCRHLPLDGNALNLHFFLKRYASHWYENQPYVSCININAFGSVQVKTSLWQFFASLEGIYKLNKTIKVQEEWNY